MSTPRHWWHDLHDRYAEQYQPQNVGPCALRQHYVQRRPFPEPRGTWRDYENACSVYLESSGRDGVACTVCLTGYVPGVDAMDGGRCDCGRNQVGRCAYCGYGPTETRRYRGERGTCCDGPYAWRAARETPREEVLDVA